MTPDELKWLTWGAIQHRPHGAPRWDAAGTAKAIADHCGNWGLDVATAHVLAHARDPKAKTPFAIKGNAPSTPLERGTWRPPTSEEACRDHPGEHATHCRMHAADRKAGVPHTPTPSDTSVTTHVDRLRAEKRKASA
jgi:hypothetical protein